MTDKQTSSLPLVSCLMVTRGDVRLITFSLLCFTRQDYSRRELLIVTDNVTPALRALVLLNGGHTVRLIEAPAGLTLGDLRNFAAARANGDVICQWDDDDLYDPSRLTDSVNALLSSKSAAVFLNRWTMWWPARRLLVISRERIWEGTICVWRHHHGVYPALKQAEDTQYVRNLRRRAQVSLLDAPQLYCYVVTGQNTWDTAHFDMLFSGAKQVFEGDAYDLALARMSERMPILQYRQALESIAKRPDADGSESPMRTVTEGQ